jgi:hypothetical protein
MKNFRIQIYSEFSSFIVALLMLKSCLLSMIRRFSEENFRYFFYNSMAFVSLCGTFFMEKFYSRMSFEIWNGNIKLRLNYCLKTYHSERSSTEGQTELNYCICHSEKVLNQEIHQNL